jgi:hypothetical protein
MEFSPLIKLLVVFASLLALTRLCVHLGAALALGGIALCVWAGRGMATGSDMAAALGQSELWLLMLNILLIMEYGRYLGNTRNASIIMDSARAWGGRHGRAFSLVALPAVIGMVPMPGGALFSAPLVGQTVPGPEWDTDWKAAVNYWFRHLLEYWWPLYPVVIVTLSIFKLELWQFILIQLPVSLAALGGGYFVLIHPHLAVLKQHELTVRPARRRLAMILLPIALTVGGALGLPGVLAWVWPELPLQTRKLLAMLIGLMAGLVIILRDTEPEDRRKFLPSLVDPKTLSILAVLGGAIFFKGMMDRSGLLPLASESLLDAGIPLVLVVAVLPFVAGFVTGVAMAFAGAAFPLLAGLAANPETGLTPAAVLVLGFACGYAGMMWSPIHLCFILSRSFFTASQRGLYRYIIPASMAPLGVALILYYVFLNGGG